MTIEERTEEERQRLTALLFDYNIPEKKTDLMRDTIENVAWMKVKLDDTREVIKRSDVAIPYVNSAGEKGVRKNPLFDGYEALWKSYQAGMRTLLELLPEKEPQIAQADSPKTVLELVRERHKA